jgi:hypothetical protein
MDDEENLVVGELELRYKRKLLGISPHMQYSDSEIVEEPKLSPKWKSYDPKLRSFKNKYNEMITKTPEKVRPSPGESAKVVLSV